MLTKLIYSEKKFTLNGTVPPVVEWLSSGEALVNMFDTFPERGSSYDVILLDYLMEALDGPSAARILRSKHRFKGIIFGVTGNIMPEEVGTFVSYGADAVFMKPFSLPDMVHLLQQRGVLTMEEEGEEEERELQQVLTN